MENNEWCKCLSRTSEKDKAIEQAKEVGKIQNIEYIVSEINNDLGQKEYHIGLTKCPLAQNKN